MIRLNNEILRGSIETERTKEHYREDDAKRPINNDEAAPPELNPKKPKNI